MASGRRLGATVAGLAVVLAACGGSAAPQATEGTGTIMLTNQGGDLEGHTPRGFAGMGTGLFAGDNLNPRFPEGDGVQLFVTFELDSPIDPVASAVLSSDVLQTSGSPFDDLGALTAEAVSYASFGPELFDHASLATPVSCTRVGDSGISCDVTDLVNTALSTDDTRLQFRLRFEQAGDGDGQQDLAMFFLTDSNTNASGIFALKLNG